MWDVRPYSSRHLRANAPLSQHKESRRGISKQVVWPLTAPALFLSVTDSSFRMAVELIANWTPLESRLAPELCAEFMWMYRENGIEHYKHVVTRRYFKLDQDARC